MSPTHNKLTLTGIVETEIACAYDIKLSSLSQTAKTMSATIIH